MLMLKTLFRRKSVCSGLLALTGLLAAHNSVAGACYFANGATTTTAMMTLPADIKVQQGAPVDTVIGTWDAANGRTDITCTATFNTWVGYDIITAAEEVSGSRHVYKTNIPGIGIRGWSGNDARYVISDRSALLPKHMGSSNAPTTGYLPSANYRIQLVVTGPVEDGTLDLSRFTAGLWYDDLPATRLQFSTPTIHVIANACEIQTGNIQVPLGDTPATLLDQPGKTSTPVNFTVGLLCDAGTNVNITYTGPIVSGRPDTLQLDNTGEAGSAKGVGVQILQANSSTPLQFGKEYAMQKAVPAGALSLPFQARYIRLESALEPGEANATATFEMTYR
ncbi:fimbrial protein [Chimaeribacter californicus]|nr:fimbrial protein [Chimaeribacter californicus]